jgi:multicomponent Na+:H+ antiporter subunit C
VTSATLFGLLAALLVGLGLYGLIAQPHPLRKILSMNLLGGGVFLFLGVVARRGSAVGLGGDPIPQALVITGLVVAFAGTALAVMLLLRLFQESGTASLRAEALPGKEAGPGKDANKDAKH